MRDASAHFGHQMEIEGCECVNTQLAAGRTLMTGLVA